VKKINTDSQFTNKIKKSLKLKTQKPKDL